MAIGAEPTIFSPAAADPATRRVNSLIYNALYRLDGRLRPIPDLAARDPQVSRDGRSWSVQLRLGVRFHDGSTLRSGDVTSTYALGLSANCPFRELCEPLARDLAAVSADGQGVVRFSLKRPSGPFLTLVLAQLPILPRGAVQESYARFVRAASGVRPAQATGLAERIAAATNDEACLGESPPPSCQLTSFGGELEALLRSAGIPLPDPRFEVGPDRRADPATYAAALLTRAQQLALALSSHGDDALAAAFPLLDLGARPVGTGPYAFSRYRPAERVELKRNDRYFGGPVGPTGVQVEILTDPSVAATALRTGEIDWLPEVSPDEVPSLTADGRLRVAARPMGYRAIVFNVRPDRLYADTATRQAFARCIDKGPAVTAASSGRAIEAQGVSSPGSWAFDDATGMPKRRDIAAARRLLGRAGWRPGPDGIQERAGRRLSSTVYVRPGRGDLLVFARTAATQLRGCGIELKVRELAFAADVLPQIEYPNDFDTYLVSRNLGLDPDSDFSIFHSSRRTTRAHPGDANFGGWQDPAADRLIETARREIDLARRRTAYRSLEALLARELPLYPIWFDPVYSAASVRVASSDGPIELRSPLSGWDVDRWRLGTP